MKNSLILFALTLVFLLPQTFALSPGPGQGDNPVLSRRGDQILRLNQVQVYETLIVFLRQKSLTTEEQKTIRQTVIAGFETDPQSVLSEVRMIGWGLAEIAKIENPQQKNEIRSELLANIQEAHLRGNDNSLVLTILHHPGKD
jgi:hypothetical protein